MAGSWIWISSSGKKIYFKGVLDEFFDFITNLIPKSIFTLQFEVKSNYKGLDAIKNNCSCWLMSKCSYVLQIEDQLLVSVTKNRILLFC